MDRLVRCWISVGLYILLLCLGVAGAAAQFSDSPIRVMFQPSSNDVLDAAIEDGFSRPPFQKTTHLSRDVLVVSIPEKIKTRKDKYGIPLWEFTVKFSRDGDPLGESYEACRSTEMSDCIDQLRVDSATAIGREARRLPDQTDKD